MFLTFLIHGLAIIAVGGIVTDEWMQQTDIVDPRVADMLGMHWLGLVIVVMGIGTRIKQPCRILAQRLPELYGGAKQGQFSKTFASLTGYGQPWKANIVIGIFSYFTVFVTGSVDQLFHDNRASAGIIYFGVSVSFLKLRKTKPHWERPYKVKYGKFSGVFPWFLAIWVIYTCAKSMDLGGWMAVGLYFALGVPFMLYAKHMQKKKPDEWKQIILSPDQVREEE